MVEKRQPWVIDEVPDEAGWNLALRRVGGLAAAVGRGPERLTFREILASAYVQGAVDCFQAVGAPQSAPRGRGSRT